MNFFCRLLHLLPLCALASLAFSVHAQAADTNSGRDREKKEFVTFYQSIANQVHDTWNRPSTSTPKDPIVSFHVERNGRVVPDSVRLARSSGDTAFDKAAIDTVKHLGQLREPLPDGCPPDISIDFNPNP